MPFLKQSLESILCQVDENFEVIVVDSLSSDGSRGASGVSEAGQIDAD